MKIEAMSMGVGRSFHQPGTVNENVLESDFVPFSDGTTRCHSLADFKGCGLSPVSGCMQASSAATSQCREIKRGVTWALLGSLKTNRAAAF